MEAAAAAFLTQFVWKPGSFKEKQDLLPLGLKSWLGRWSLIILFYAIISKIYSIGKVGPSSNLALFEMPLPKGTQLP